MGQMRVIWNMEFVVSLPPPPQVFFLFLLDLSLKNSIKPSQVWEESQHNQLSFSKVLSNYTIKDILLFTAQMKMNYRTTLLLKKLQLFLENTFLYFKHFSSFLLCSYSYIINSFPSKMAIVYLCLYSTLIYNFWRIEIF